MGPYRTGREALAHVGELSYFVDRESRGKWIGSLLLQHAMKQAPACGLGILVAILLDKNTASIAADHLYYGFKL